MQEADAACRAAIYVRLSVEDTHTHSVSIETQQMIIARYLEQYPQISVYDTYIDNGATGTNFHRPGFQQMLSEIEAGHVNCVIVKDLSRLGRNTIDTGYYIEQYFLIRNIRFIAVNENFDTAAPEDAHSGIIIPLRNMINEAYALDIGRKIRAQQRQAMKDGKFIGARISSASITAAICPLKPRAPSTPRCSAASIRARFVPTATAKAPMAEWSLTRRPLPSCSLGH